MTSIYPVGSIAWLAAQVDQAKQDDPKVTIVEPAPVPEVSLTATRWEAFKAELQAVHSDLGDASQAVFDMLEVVREKEATITKLEARVNALKAELAAIKSQTADAAPTQLALDGNG